MNRMTQRNLSAAYKSLKFADKSFQLAIGNEKTGTVDADTVLVRHIKQLKNQMGPLIKATGELID